MNKVKLPKDFGRIKMEEEVNDIKKPTCRHGVSWDMNCFVCRNEEEADSLIIKDTKRRTQKRHSDDKMHPASILAIGAGFVAMIAVVLYLGVIVDAFIGLMKI